MKLNIGSGAPPAGFGIANGWVNVDALAWPVEVRADACALPFRDGTFEAVHCAHLIEHLRLDTVPAFLCEVRRVMRRDAVLFISAPDGDRARDVQSDYWVRMTKRGGAVPGWSHEWVCTVRKLRVLLHDADLVPTWATALPQGHPPNSHGWPVDLEARFLCRRGDFGWPNQYAPPYSAVRIWATG